MQTYTVHEGPNPPADRFERAERLEFVKEGFDWIAAALTPLWLLMRRLWLLLLGYLIVVGGLRLGLDAMGADPRAWQVLTAAIHLLIGLEADTLQRWTLDKRGYVQVGSVVGRSIDECERRFLDAWLPELRTGSAPGLELGRAATAFASSGAESRGRSGGLLGWPR